MKKRSMIGKGSLAILFFVFVSNYLFAQDTIRAESETKYNFIKDQQNEIANSATLSVFFEKLYQLKKKNKGTVNIVHIGDSHIQADLLTHTVRQLLQKQFGNAGRGFIFPGRIARTNEPQNIYTSSDANWESKRMVFTDQPLPIGLGASTVRTTQADAKFIVRTMDSAPLNYSFDQISIFYQKDFTSFNLMIRDSVGHSLAYAGPYTTEGYLNFSSVTLPYPVHQVELQTSQPTPSQRQFTLFGLSLIKNAPGVCYHAIGGNGAKFKHYLETQFFFEQTKALSPDLFIISLGTNEAMEYPYVDKL